MKKKALKVKRSQQNLKKVECSENFSTKAKGTEIYIEGLANANTVDRGREIIATDAWELDNFKKNPVILLNHGFDKMGGIPIGIATAVQPTDAGLKIRAKISSSDHPDIKLVRDLISEGMLRAFSVGFEPKEIVDEKMEGGDTIAKITKAELFEVSVVGVPMNQDSVFQLTEKSLKSYAKSKTGITDLKLAYLKSIQNKQPLRVHEVITEHGMTTADRLKFMLDISRALKIKLSEVKSMFVGQVEFSEKVLEKITDETGLKAEDLAPKDDEEETTEKSSSELLKEALEKIADGADEKEVMEALHAEWHRLGNPCEDKDDDKANDEDEEESDPDLVDNIDNPDDDKTDDDEKALKDFQDCVNGKIPGLIADGMEQDAAVAAAIAQCGEDGEKCQLPDDVKAMVFEKCFEAVEAFKESGEWTDVKLVKQAQVEGEPTETVAMDMAKDVDENPHLLQAKQTNVLLGGLISEFQKLFNLLEGNLRAAPASDDEERPDENDSAKNTAEEEKEKRLASAIAKLKSLEERAAKLN